MRLCLEFKTKKSEMVIEYRKCIVSFIKKTLTIAHEGKYYKNFYCDTKKKPFTFSAVFAEPVFSRDRVKFSNNNFKVYFSVVDENRMGLILCNCFLKMSNKKFDLPDNNEMYLTNIRKLNETLIVNDRAVFKTKGGSPVIVKEHNSENNKDKYYTCEDDSYKEKLQEKIRYQFFTEGYDQDIVNQIIVNDVNGKKVVVKSYGIYVDGVSGFFDISAPSEILQKIYLEGLSSKRSMGFGYVDLVR